VGGGGDPFVYSDEPVDVNVWYHVAVTRDSASHINFYVYGVWDGGGSAINVNNTGIKYRIGTINTGHWPFNGIIDDVRIYDIALSAKETMQLYHQYDMDYYYHLDANSPCINAGDPNGDYSGQVDIDGYPRLQGPRVDMGAHEVVYGAFLVLDDSDTYKAIFDNLGNLFLKGTMDESTSHTATAADEFIIEDSNGSELAVIDANDGNMYIDGQVFESQGTLTPSGTNNFIIEDANGNTVAYIDDPNGDLYLKGVLYEQALIN
jgi:hypothetical protein